MIIESSFPATHTDKIKIMRFTLLIVHLGENHLDKSSCEMEWKFVQFYIKIISVWIFI